MLFSKKEKRMIYENEYVAQLDTGQIVFLNLKIAKGLANLASIFEFITIDKDQKIMEFSYAEGTITKGKQQIQFSKKCRTWYQTVFTIPMYKNEKFKEKKRTVQKCSTLLLHTTLFYNSNMQAF